MADSSGTYGIKGLPRPETAITRSRDNGIPYVEGLPVRLEVSALADSTEPLLQRQWTLFVLALERFKLKPVDDKLSYFQVAGIVSCDPLCLDRIHSDDSTAWLS